MDVDALAKTKVGKKGCKEKDKGGKSKKFEGWCGAYGHMMEDCHKKAAGKPQDSKSPRGPDPKSKGKAEGGKGKKRTSSLDEWPDGQENPPSDEKAIKKVARLFAAVSRHKRYSQRDWQAWERIQKQTQDQWKSYRSGNLCANAVDAELGERIDLTIDSGCAVRALLVDVASTFGMQELNRTPQGYIAANAEKSRELGFQDSDTQIQNGDVQKFEVQCYGQVAQTSGGSVQGCCSWQSDCATARESRWHLHRRCPFKARETNL